MKWYDGYSGASLTLLVELQHLRVLKEFHILHLSPPWRWEQDEALLAHPWNKIISQEDRGYQHTRSNRVSEAQDKCELRWLTLWIKLWHHTWPQLLPLYLNLSSFWTNFLSKGYNMWDTYDTICSSTRIRNMFCIKGYGMLTWLILFVSSLAIIDLDIVDVVGSGMVADGTPCGSGKVCINFDYFYKTFSNPELKKIRVKSIIFLMSP